MKDFRQLKVWERAHELTLAVYEATRSFPAEERYGLTAQLRRASASVPTNIAEGCGRDGPRDFARFVSIALGSNSETEYLALLARDLKYLSPDTCAGIHEKTSEIKKMLLALHRKLHHDAAGQL